MPKLGRKENLVPAKPGNKLAEKPFNKEEFEKLCKIGCTEKEIMFMLGYAKHDTLNAKLRAEYDGTFEEVYPKFFSHALASLRRIQFKAALEGSVPMQIWLGKQYLGQKDKQEIETKEDSKLQITRVVMHRTVDEVRKSLSNTPNDKELDSN